jgi:hypothetical protein
MAKEFLLRDIQILKAHVRGQCHKEVKPLIEEQIKKAEKVYDSK